MKTTDDFFIILCPSRDGKMFADTVHILECVARRMGKESMVICSDGLTFWDARNNVIQKFKKACRIYGIQITTPIRALWIDNDILIDESIDDLYNILGSSDAGGLNIIANYKTTWTDGNVANTIMFPLNDGTYRTATDAELKDLCKQYPPPKIVGGLGFYYGDVPTGYKYGIREPYQTEDIPFFLDAVRNIQYVPIKLLHNKNVML